MRGRKLGGFILLLWVLMPQNYPPAWCVGQAWPSDLRTPSGEKCSKPWMHLGIPGQAEGVGARC